MSIKKTNKILCLLAALFTFGCDSGSGSSELRDNDAFNFFEQRDLKSCSDKWRDKTQATQQGDFLTYEFTDEVKATVTKTERLDTDSNSYSVLLTTDDIERTFVFDQQDFLENCQSLKEEAQFLAQQMSSDYETKNWYGNDVIDTLAGEFEVSWQKEIITDRKDEIYYRTMTSYYAKNKYNQSILVKRVAGFRDQSGTVVYTEVLVDSNMF